MKPFIVLSILGAAALLPSLVCAESRPSDSGTLSLDYRKQRLSAHIQGAALTSVLEALERETGTRFRFLSSETGDLPIWTHFESLSLSAGIRKILDDVPYVHHADARGSTIFVLFSASTKARFAHLGSARTAASRVPAGVDGDSRPEVDAAIDRSIEQLKSASPSDQIMAITQLSGSRDERAIDALVEAATTEGADEVRVEATSALSQAAVADPDESSKARRVLEQLAMEHNPYVRDVARATLQTLKNDKAVAKPTEDADAT